MIHLLASICCATSIFIIFKGFEKYEIHILYAIIINYLAATFVGFSFYSGNLSVQSLVNQHWFVPAVVLGMLFPIVFNLMALTSQKMGVSAASVATKMSLIIPVVLSVYLHNETLNHIKILGVSVALGAVFLASHKPRVQNRNNKFIYLPILVFIGSGIIDAGLRYLQDMLATSSESPLLSSCIFASASLSGVVLSVFSSKRGLQAPRLKDIVGGILLGVLNYFAVYFLLRALQFKGLSSASIFTLNNVGVVLFTTLLGILLFKEKLTFKNRIGVFLAVVSIVLMGI